MFVLQTSRAVGKGEEGLRRDPVAAYSADLPAKLGLILGQTNLVLDVRVVRLADGDDREELALLLRELDLHAILQAWVRRDHRPKISFHVLLQHLLRFDLSAGLLGAHDSIPPVMLLGARRVG